MQPHQQRVVDEKIELDEKLSKLILFFDTKIFSSLDVKEQNRLKKQSEYMKLYSDVLEERILNFS